MGSIILLAFVQGLTEFLPVSSSGHLSLLEKYLNFNSQEALSVSLILHLGTVCSVLVFYHKVFLFFLKNFIKYKIFLYYIILACIPTAIIGFFLKGVVGQIVFNLPLISLFFLITAIVLLVSHWVCKRRESVSGEVYFEKNIDPQILFNCLSSLDVKKVLLIGFVQGLAVFPGLSRSGLTIATGRLLGLTPVVSGFFSFVLMIPVVLGASLLEFSSVSLEFISFEKIFFGFLIAFITGLLVLKLLQYILAQDKFYYFGYYLLLLGIGVCLI